MEKANIDTPLKDLFTGNKFSFIERLDSDIESSKKLLEESQKSKELIDSLVYSLNNYINTDSDDNKEDIINNINSISELIDYNIKILKSTNEISNSIKQHIVDILVKTDESNNSQYDYTSEMYNFKNEIEQYSSMLEKSNPQVTQNNKQIEEFFNQPDVKKYIKIFSLQSNKDSELNTNNEQQLKNEKIFTAIKENNNVLLVSEKDKKVYLPYSKEEVLEYMKQYPNKYSSFNDVVRNEFIFSSDIYLKHTLASRFRETYSLMRDREAKTILESFKYAIDIMFHYDLNPAIIAACKTQEQLENYIKCLEENNLSNFKDFEIRFEVTPLHV